MLTEDQVHNALTDVLGYDAIDALIVTADERGEALLVARGEIPVELHSTTDTTDPQRYTLHIGARQ